MRDIEALNAAGIDTNESFTQRYSDAMLGVFGAPQLVLERGEGRHVYDVEGNCYLDLLGGIATTSLGHGNQELIEAITRQAQDLIHVSNFFTTRAQIELGERLLQVADADKGARVFLCNSGTEANEAAFKLARATGRPNIVVADGAFHGRTMGALSLTAKEAYRAPFEPLIAGVIRVPYNDVEALRTVLDEHVGAVLLEPIQGEAGVVVPDDDYLVAARELTTNAGALLILDEVQTGVGRTGAWFAHTRTGITPDAMTLAKGLGGGVPIGALLTLNEHASGLLTAGQHGTTFGGNPLACAAANAVLFTIESLDLLAHVEAMFAHVEHAVTQLRDERITEVRGRGLLIGLGLRDAVGPQLVEAARKAGFIVNAPNANTLRLAPALTITAAELDEFVTALPTLLDQIGQS